MGRPCNCQELALRVEIYREQHDGGHLQQCRRAEVGRSCACLRLAFRGFRFRVGIMMKGSRSQAAVLRWAAHAPAWS